MVHAIHPVIKELILAIRGMEKANTTSLQTKIRGYEILIKKDDSDDED